MVKKNTSKSDYNRALILIVFGIFSVLWVIINSADYTSPGITYLIVGAVLIYLYREWSRIGIK